MHKPFLLLTEVHLSTRHFLLLLEQMIFLHNCLIFYFSTKCKHFCQLPILLTVAVFTNGGVPSSRDAIIGEPEQKHTCRPPTHAFLRTGRKGQQCEW